MIKRRARKAISESLFGTFDDVDPLSAESSTVRVVTFDLDNTLWKTSEVISAANDALSTYLKEKGVVAPVRTEVVMGKLFKQDKRKYCPYLEEEEEEEEVNAISGANKDNAGYDESIVENVGRSSINIRSGSDKPVLLTQLRKDAIRHILIRHNNYSIADATSFADDAFEIWTAARHDAIPANMALSVPDVLERIRSLRIFGGGGAPPIIGAITDGNSDPRIVPIIGKYFDFVVQSESVGVAKPDRKVYDAAVAIVSAMPSASDLFRSANPAVDADGNVDQGVVDQVLGRWWCHVGDDFIKDCIAAKDMRMRTVWCRELVLEEGKMGKDGSIPGGNRRAESPDQTTTTTRTTTTTSRGKKKKKRDAADLVKELAEMKVVQMAIGAEDFLADSIQREFADEILDRFADLGDTLARWHEEGLAAAAAAAADAASGQKGTDVRSKKASAVNAAAIADVIEVIVPDDVQLNDQGGKDTETVASGPGIRPVTERAEVGATQSKQDSKFCMFCGTRLPRIAKFCSSCGEKQGDI